MIRLKTLRQAAGITQEMLAAKLGITREAIAMWETGKTSPQLKYLVATAKILGCTVDDLLNPDPTERP